MKYKIIVVILIIILALLAISCGSVDDETKSEWENLGEEIDNDWNDLFNATYIEMPKYSWQYDDWEVDKAVTHFKELGFVNVVTEETTDTGMFSKFHEEKELADVEIEDTWLGTWSAGDSFKSTSKITIKYYNRTPTLTIDNCPDLATVLTSTDIMYSDFSEKYDGYFIEFDGYISNYSNSFSTIIVEARYGDSANENPNGLSIKIDVSDTAGDETNINKNVSENMNVKVIGKVDNYYTDYYKMICIDAAYLMER